MWIERPALVPSYRSTVPPPSADTAAGNATAWGWVRGRLDADYHGPDASLDDLPWSSEIRLVRAHVTEVERVSGPPDPRSQETLRQASLEPAWLEVDGALLPATLHDVHVQDHLRVAAIVRTAESDVVGRLRGTVWARLGHPPAESPTTASEPSTADGHAPTSEALTGADDESSPPSTPAEGASAPSEPDPTDGWFDEAPSASTSGTLGSPDDQGPSSEPDLPTLDGGPHLGNDGPTDPVEPLLDFASHPTEPNGPTPSRLAARGTGCGCLPLLAILTFLVLLASCGLTLALTWLAVIAAGLYAQRWFEQRMKRPHGCWRWLLSWLLVAAHVFLLLTALQEIGVAPCDPRGAWVAAVLALPVLASAMLPSRLLWATTSVLWSIGLLVWCTQADDLCLAGDDVAASESHVTRALERTARELESRFEEVIASDEVARLLSENTDRMSVDDALLDPDQFFGTCGQPLVLSGDILFAHDSDQLDPAAEPHLRKLRRLLAMRPETHILVVGHADPKGDPAYNVDLSQRRAQSVVAWLEANGGVAKDRMEVLGRGSADLVVQEPNLLALNRRVEVSLACD